MTPSTYTGAIHHGHYQRRGLVYGVHGSNGGHHFAPGTVDTSNPQFQDTDPQSGGSGGKAYDLDAPGISRRCSQVGRIRYNFAESAQLPDGTHVSNEVDFYVRVSCNWGSAGNSFRNEFSGDNVLGLGTTATTWNLQ